MLGTAVEPEFRPDLPGEAERNLADVSAARALGWAPRTTLEAGLRAAIEYIRAQGLQPAL
jgi:nucleoside-diphosphate-sugar epimerase